MSQIIKHLHRQLELLSFYDIEGKVRDHLTVSDYYRSWMVTTQESPPPLLKIGVK